MRSIIRGVLIVAGLAAVTVNAAPGSNVLRRDSSTNDNQKTPSGNVKAAVLSGDPAPLPPDTATRVHLHPDSVRLMNDSDYNIWTVPVKSDLQAVNITVNDIFFKVSAKGKALLGGGSYKLHYTRFVESLGERNIGEGVTAQLDDGTKKSHPLQLVIKGLPKGNHTLLAFHNAWDRINETATLDVKLNGETVLENVAQTIRVDNIWESGSSYINFSVTGPKDKVTIVFKPKGADGRAFLNGFEINTPSLSQQISFPDPPNRFERVELNGGSTTASWRGPAVHGSAYNIFIGTSPDKLKSIATGLLEVTTFQFRELNVFDTYYWRVDVAPKDGPILIGRTFSFRAAQLAFPGAEGYGRYSRGGRGGRVIKVTTLEDNEEPGSLRYALSVQKGPRIVVFDVGGVIETKERMVVNDQYLTVAGQTAPGKGIAITGWPLGLSGASDVIFRHMRVRPGTSTNQTVDGMGMQGSNYCIFDRCSMGWALDESFSSRSAYNITFQRNMISEPLNIAGHKNYPPGTQHGFAATIGGDIGSFHHNLIAHAEGRSWSLGGGVDADGYFAGRLDIRNNVVYNFGDRVTDGGVHECNFVGNFYKHGPASTVDYALKAQYEDQLPGTQQYYCEGNSMPGHFTQDSVQYPPGDGTSIKSDIACWADVTIFNPPPEYRHFKHKPFWNDVSYVEEQSSTEAYKRVLSDSGASQPVQDDHDKRIVNETYHGTYTYVGSVSGKPGLLDNEKDAGGLEDFPSVTRDSSWDTDDDGIADWWDGSTGGDGYTVIEGYLNFMADPHVYVTPGGNATIDLAAMAKGFDRPTFSVSGAGKGQVKSKGSTATYVAGKTAGIDYFNIDIEDDEGSTWRIKYGVAIFVGADEAQ